MVFLPLLSRVLSRSGFSAPWELQGGRGITKDKINRAERAGEREGEREVITQHGFILTAMTNSTYQTDGFRNKDLSLIKVCYVLELEIN